MPDIKNFSDISDLFVSDDFVCSCGKRHTTSLRALEIGKGVLKELPGMLGKFNGAVPFIVADRNTWKVAGEKVFHLLTNEGFKPEKCILESDRPEPDEYWTGKLDLYWKQNCDSIIAVGSGTLNDLCKILAARTRLPFITVGTAPSMDGFASDSASMMLDGLKQSLPAVCPWGIIADTAIMATAPKKMLQAGIGDMLAKYVSICEWRISHLLTGEYYCEEIAGLIRKSLRKCVDSVEAFISGNTQAVGYVVEGLVLSGMAMSFAGISRPASGIEHYFSHVWDMTAILKHEPAELHGIQVGIGTLLAIDVYEQIRKIKPDRKTAVAYLDAFDASKWKERVEKSLGPVSESFAEKQTRWLVEQGKQRLPGIIEHWNDVLKILDGELPEAADLHDIFTITGAPTCPADIGITAEKVRESFIVTKDIRQKYVASTLLSDIGYLEIIAGIL